MREKVILLIRKDFLFCKIVILLIELSRYRRKENYVKKYEN